MTIVLVAVPIAVILYPSNAGAVSGPVSVIVTGAVMVAAFNAEMAADREA